MLCESVLSQKSINFFLSKRNLFLESRNSSSPKRKSQSIVIVDYFEWLM